MQLLLTLALLAVVTAGIVVLRLRWASLSRWTHRALFLAACIAILLCALGKATDWSTTSEHINALFTWSALAGYEFFLMLFSTLRPRRLTSIIAIVLIVPLLSTTVVLELTYLFKPIQPTIVDLGYGFYSSRIPWSVKHSDSSGIDLAVYYHPGLLPLRRRVQGARFYNTQCVTGQTYAVLQPDHNSVLVVCPALPNQPPDSGRNVIVNFY